MKKLVFVLLCGVLLVGAYYARVTIVQKVTPVVAASLGVNVDALQVRELNAEQLSVKHLRLSQQDEQFRMTVELNNIDVTRGELTDLQKLVSSVVAERVVVNLYQLDGEVGGEQSAVAVKEYIKQLPLFGVSIKQLEINYHAQEQIQAEFAGSVEYTDSISMQGQLRYNDYRGQVEFLLHEGELKAQFKREREEKAHEDVINVSGWYAVDNDWLTLQAKTDYQLHDMQQLVGRDSSITPSTAQGQINARAELDMTTGLDELLLALVVELEVDSSLTFSSTFNPLRSGELDVRAQCVIAQQQIYQCTVNQPQKLVLEFASTPALIEDYISLRSNRFHVELNPADTLTMKRSPLKDNGFQVEGGLKLSAYPQTSEFMLGAEFSGIDAQWVNEQWSLAGDYALALDVKQLQQPFNARRVTLSGDGKLQLDNQQAQLQIKDGAKLSAFDVTQDDVVVDVLEVRQLGNAGIEYAVEKQMLRGGKHALQLVATGARYADSEMTMNEVTLALDQYRFSSAKQFVAATLSANEVEVKHRDLTVPVSDLQTAIKLDNNTLELDAGLQFNHDKTPLRMSLKNELSSGSGIAQFESQVIPLSANAMVAHIIGVTGFPLQIDDGGFSVQGELSWEDNYQDSRTRLDISAKQIDGNYAQSPFVNLNVDMSLAQHNGWVLSAPAKLTIDSINVGVPLNDIAMQIEEYEYGVREQPALKIVDLYAAALEGSIYTDTVAIDLNRPLNMFSFYLSSLSLQKLVELNQTQDLLATGIINGELPVVLNDGVLEINNGWLRADEKGGYIKYKRIADVLSGGKDLELVAQLLEDFQYTEMSTAVDLNPGGALTLQTKLHGRSPEAEFDVPINLNFNIDFNLWKFLESVRLLTRIGQDVTEQVSGSQGQSNKE